MSKSTKINNASFAYMLQLTTQTSASKNKGFWKKICLHNFFVYRCKIAVRVYRILRVCGSTYVNENGNKYSHLICDFKCVRLMRSVMQSVHIHTHTHARAGHLRALCEMGSSIEIVDVVWL